MFVIFVKIWHFGEFMSRKNNIQRWHVSRWMVMRNWLGGNEKGASAKSEVAFASCDCTVSRKRNTLFICISRKPPYRALPINPLAVAFIKPCSYHFNPCVIELTRENRKTTTPKLPHLHLLRISITTNWFWILMSSNLKTWV